LHKFFSAMYCRIKYHKKKEADVEGVIEKGHLRSNSKLSERNTVIFWALAGAAVVLLQSYVYSAWILSGQPARVSPGTDPVPFLVQYGLPAFQVINIALFIGAFIKLFRSVLSVGTFTAFQLMMIGWLFTYWQDPWLSARFPIFTYNNNLFSYGCWCEFLPGWSTPNGSRLPEPILLNIPAYFILLPLAILPGLAMLKKLVAKVPDASGVKRYFAAMGGILIWWIPLELVSTRLIHADTWPGSIRSLSIWAGEFYQMPIYEFFLFPAILAGCAMLLHASENGKSFVEYGLSKMKLGNKATQLMRVLAFIAFANLMNGLYIGTMVLISTQADPWPESPSWMRGELCGDELSFCDIKP
jgi:hypothetical protein